MNAIDDDALRGMLAARADRLQPGADAAVMAAVRTSVRGPRQGAAFAVLPVLTGRTPVIGAGWAAAAMIAVLVMAIAVTRPPTASPSVSTPGGIASASAPGGPPASASSAASPAPSTRVQPVRLSLADFTRAVADHSLDGHLVLVDSTLRNALAGCAGSLCPQEYRLDLVGPVVTQMRPAFPVVPAAPAVGTGPLAGVFVVVPSGGSLALVGRLEGSIGSPLDLSRFQGFYQPPDPGAEIALQAVAGTLERNVITPCPNAGPCGPADVISWSSGSGATNLTRVLVDAPAIGIDPSAGSVEGPFLVRTGTHTVLEIVGRYDLAAVTTVDLPATRCDLPAGAKVPSCDEVEADALAGLPPAGAITSIEVAQGAYCPPGTACPTIEADRAHVIVHGSVGDWLVTLVYGPDGRLVSAIPAPLPSP